MSRNKREGYYVGMSIRHSFGGKKKHMRYVPKYCSKLVPDGEMARQILDVRTILHKEL